MLSESERMNRNGWHYLRTVRADGAAVLQSAVGGLSSQPIPAPIVERPMFRWADGQQCFAGRRQVDLSQHGSVRRAVGGGAAGAIAIALRLDLGCQVR
jgi:hypothetical protein